MKAIYMNIALAALAFSAVACTQEEDFAPSFLNDPDAVRITAQVASGNVTGGFTRSNPLGTTEEQAIFNDDDQIAVTADGQDAVTYTFNGTDTWTPEEGKYLKWEEDEMNFTAWYPVGERTDANTFTVHIEYTEESPIADADYMVYTGTQNKTSGNGVTLPMKRKMARIVITPVLNDEFATGYSITGIKVHANTSGYANGEPQTGNIQVSALKQDDVYYALLAPTTAADATFLTVTVTKTDDSTSQEFTVKGIPTTEAGKSYEYTLTVGKAEASIGSVKVNPWTDGTINGGKAEKEIPYLTFKAGNSQTLDLEQRYEEYDDYYLPYPGDGDDTGYIEYSVGNSNEWTKFTPTSQPVPFGGDKGDLHLRGISPNGTLKAQIVFEENNPTPVACSGDIRTLVNWENYETAVTSSAIFYRLFENCTVLTSAPELPATVLANQCYKSMFWGCTSLAVAPELPATSLAESCYNQMFAGCTSLNAAPELPATTLADDCYNGMFAGCTSLNAAPELPATTLAGGCYISMFKNCTSLTSAPLLAAEELVTSCYYDMFRDCTSLNSVTMLATDISASNCLTNWLEGVAATGTFTKAAGMESLPTGVNGIPSGWTVQNYVAPGEEN